LVNFITCRAHIGRVNAWVDVGAQLKAHTYFCPTVV
jgi:hypothetical protein